MSESRSVVAQCAQQRINLKLEGAPSQSGIGESAGHPKRPGEVACVGVLVPWLTSIMNFERLIVDESCFLKKKAPDSDRSPDLRTSMYHYYYRDSSRARHGPSGPSHPVAPIKDHGA